MLVYRPAGIDRRLRPCLLAVANAAESLFHLQFLSDLGGGPLKT
jgi:hypothetical protein